MQILMIAPQPYFEPRGTPLSVHQRLWALSQLNHQIDLLTYHVGVDVSIPNVRILRIPAIPLIKVVKIGPSWTKLILDIVLFCYAITLFLKKPYEVLHTHEEASFFAPILSKVFGCKHIYDMHSSLALQLSAFNFGNHWPITHIFKLLERWVINRSDAIITVDDSLTARVLAIKPDSFVLTIENLALQHFESRISEITPNVQKTLNGRIPIVYTGTFERYQGLSLLLNSMKQVVEQVPEAILVLVGGTRNQVLQLKAEADQLGLEGWVHFTGVLPPEEAIAFTEIAEVLVSPRLEGTSVPLKLYSYLQAGKPMVVTNIPAHTLILNGDTALFVEPTIDSLANGLLQVICSSDLGGSLGRNAYQFAQHINNREEYLFRLTKIYENIGQNKESVNDILSTLEV